MNQTRSQHIHEQSLRVLLDNQQPGGAYLACPTMPDYRFSWFRDGAYIAYALTVDGQHSSYGYNGSMAAQWESAARFHMSSTAAPNALNGALSRPNPVSGWCWQIH